MATVFEYPRSSTLYDKVDLEKLDSQIRSSTIVTALDSCAEIPAGTIRVVFKSDLSAGDETKLATVIGQHDGEPVGKSAPISVVSRPFTTEGRKISVKGGYMTALAGKDTSLDFQFGEDREVQGLTLATANHKDGDFIEVFVVIPDQGQGEQVYMQWGETVYIPPDGKLEYTAEVTDILPAGVIIRLTYTSQAVENSGDDAKVYVYLRTWK